ncbi:MAG: transcriptional repressor NrdR [DPANN group archaeon]|nr:transcriptional repressor NrdR [DPANN group archaeon]
MRCPYCSHEALKVVDKRDTEDNIAIRRRRECLKCQKRFTTYERIELLNIHVIKRDGSKQGFDREKIRRGLLIATQKRDISLDRIEDMVDSIEASIRSKNQKEINSSTIGELVLKKLKRLDKVAYIRFAAVYRSFTDLDSFRQELEKLEKR